MPTSIFWRIAWRSLKLNLRRHLLTGSAFAMGFAGTIMISGWVLSLEHQMAAQTVYTHHVGHVTIFKKDGRLKHLSQPALYSLTPAEQEAVETIVRRVGGDEIDKVGKALRGSGMVSNDCSTQPFIAKAVDVEIESWSRTHPLVVKHLGARAMARKGIGYWQADRTGENGYPVNLAPKFAKNLGKPKVSSETSQQSSGVASSQLIDCGDPESRNRIAGDANVQLITKGFHGGISGIDAQIVGHVSSGVTFTDEFHVSLGLDAAKNLFNTDNVTHMMVYLREGTSLARFSRNLEVALAKEKVPAEIYPFDDIRVAELYVGNMRFMYVLTANFIVLVCGIVIFSIVNALNISLLERRAEINSLRALGFRPSVISSIFVRENILLSILSFAVGGLIALGMSWIANAADIRYSLAGTEGEIPFVIEPDASLSALAFLILLVLVCGSTYITCQRFMKLRIADTAGGQ